MKRSVEIINILRSGMEEMVSKEVNLKIKFLRIFNFRENKVCLRMEVARGDMQFIPMGKIDVSELSSNNGVGSCDCILTELSTGVSNRILLRLKNSQQKLEQSQKVFSFFGSVIGINTDQGEKTNQNIENNDDALAKDSNLGFPMEATRGAQSPEEKPIG